MGYDYFGSRIFHAVVRLLNDGEMVTHETLYRLGLERIIDRTTWLLDEIHRLGASLASSSSGTKATVIGTRNLSTFTRYDAETNPSGELGPGGMLDGKALVLAEDTGAPEEVLFKAPMNAAEVISQMLEGAPTNKAAILDESARVVLMSQTRGASSSLEVSGPAASVLGLPVGVAKGTGAIEDGASKIGFAPVGDLSAYNVRDALLFLIETTGWLMQNKASLKGDTFTGPVTFNETVTFNGPVEDAKWDYLPSADAPVDTTKASVLVIPAMTTARTYTVGAPGQGPRRVRFVRPWASNAGATIRRSSDNSVVAALASNGIAWVELWYLQNMWRPVAWGGAVTIAGW